MIELALPWPSKDLSPNARVHCRVKAKATKAARQAALVLAFEVGLQDAWLPEGRLDLWFDCYQAPGKKLPDDDDMLGRCTAYRDGIA